MSFDNEELNPNVTILDRMPLEYTTHEELTMSMEREANRKLKAQIRKNRKLKKGMGVRQWMGEAGVYHYTNVTKEKIEEFLKDMFNDNSIYII